MIELPEAHAIAGQITETLQGKRIAEAVRGNTPHKFAFYTGEPEHYAAALQGGVIGAAEARGSCIIVPVDPGWAVILGCGGERILYHPTPRTLPAKHHFLLRFEDDSCLSVSIQGWGAAQLVPADQVATASFAGERRPCPLDDEFTVGYLSSLFTPLESGSPASLKCFIISKPGVCGVGNGCLQDILFRARLHPRRPAGSLNGQEHKALHAAIRGVITEATAAGGRDTERDLFGHRGGYVRLLDSRTVGQPCPVCRTPFEKIAYLGGACYFCPTCQQ